MRWLCRPPPTPPADKDKDGRISMEDLEISLRHVAVACPKTRCVYRCNSHGKIAQDLFSRAVSEGDRWGPKPSFPLRNFTPFYTRSL
jgi:hypothetical protein